MPDQNKVYRTSIWDGTAWKDTSEDARFVNIDGDTMTGTLTVAAPFNANSGLSQPIIAGDIPMGRAPGSSIAMGTDALKSVTTGRNNYAIGYGALQNVTTQAENTAVGMYAGQKVTGGNNTIVGSTAGQFATGITESVLVGKSAGQGTAGSAPSGANLILIGSLAGNGLTTAADVVAIGRQANADPATATMSGTVAIGSGVNTRAALSVAIGSSGTFTNAAKTVQLLPNVTTGAKVFAGIDQLAAKAELKAIAAASTSFADFQTRMAAW